MRAGGSRDSLAFAREVASSSRELLSLAQAFRYEVVEQTPGAFALSGTFVDNPVLLGGRRSNGELKGCLRFDDMQLQLLPNSLEVSGEGHCDFYGPYTVTGELVLNEQRTKASLRIAKLRPPTRRA